MLRPCSGFVLGGRRVDRDVFQQTEAHRKTRPSARSEASPRPAELGRDVFEIGLRVAVTRTERREGEAFPPRRGPADRSSSNRTLSGHNPPCRMPAAWQAFERGADRENEVQSLLHRPLKSGQVLRTSRCPQVAGKRIAGRRYRSHPLHARPSPSPAAHASPRPAPCANAVALRRSTPRRLRPDERNERPHPTVRAHAGSQPRVGPRAGRRSPGAATWPPRILRDCPQGGPAPGLDDRVRKETRPYFDVTASRLTRSEGRKPLVRPKYVVLVRRGQTVTTPPSPLD